MRVILTLAVRDEVDVVSATIEHHLAAGVSMVIATDNGSTDGTVDVLYAYRDAGVLELFQEPTHDHEQGRWVTRMARRAATVHAADWVINGDADEFFWPRDVPDPGPAGLSDALATIDAEHGIVTVQRNNLISSPDQRGGWVDRLVVFDVESLYPGTSMRIHPKVCHRADPDVVVGPGNHTASGPQIGSAAEDEPLQVLHVPDRSYTQYRQKIENGGSALVGNKRFSSDVGFHWREDYVRLRQGELADLYHDRQLTVDQLQSGLIAGTFIRDSRLRDRLYDLVPRAVVPWALQNCLTYDVTPNPGT